MIQIIYKRLEELTPYENNPRKNEASVGAVMQSIQTFGFLVPMVIDKNNTIVCGHTRYKAAVKLGLAKVPCIVADDLTQEQINAFRLADNKVGESSKWDWKGLEDELRKLLPSDIDMSLFGFDVPLPEDDEIPDNLPPESQVETDIKPGDIFLLGEHRLMCGDSTKAEDVAKLMDEKLADLVVTDPPYNINYGTKTELINGLNKSHGKVRSDVKHDHLGDDDFFFFLDSAYKNMADVLKPGGAFYIWHPIAQAPVFMKALKHFPLHYASTLIWVKGESTLSVQDYQLKHEPCIYGWKEGAKHFFISARNEHSVIDCIPNLRQMGKKELIAFIENRLNDMCETVIREAKPASSKLHPTQKPVSLMSRLIRNSSRPGEIVLDLFGGSGSTLIAADKMGRKCYMMEYEPRYVQTIINRWEEETGSKAEKIV